MFGMYYFSYVWILMGHTVETALKVRNVIHKQLSQTDWLITVSCQVREAHSCQFLFQYILASFEYGKVTGAEKYNPRWKITLPWPETYLDELKIVIHKKSVHSQFLQNSSLSITVASDPKKVLSKKKWYVLRSTKLLLILKTCWIPFHFYLKSVHYYEHNFPLSHHTLWPTLILMLLHSWLINDVASYLEKVTYIVTFLMSWF